MKQRERRLVAARQGRRLAVLLGSHRGGIDACARRGLQGRDLLLLSHQNIETLGIQAFGTHYLMRLHDRLSKTSFILTSILASSHTPSRCFLKTLLDKDTEKPSWTYIIAAFELLCRES
jgi:hypothetical protein